MLNRNYRYILKMCFTGMFVLISVKVQALEDLSIRENIHQQQRLDDLTKQFTHDGILKPKQKVEKRSLTTLVEHEAHCFQINQLKFIINDPLLLNNTSKLNDLFYALNQKNIVVGQCIGTQSLKNIIRYAQGELIKKGYVTSQLIVNDQDLSRGELVLNLQLGRVHQIYSKDAALSKSEIYTAFPIKRGDILDIKRIDQGLENLRKNLSHDVDIKIEPAVTQNGEKLVGYSDLFIISHLDKKIGINIGVDNSGYKNTGVYIGNLGISINSPLHLNDVLNLNLSHSLDNWHKDLNQNNYMSYVVPFKNYELSANYNEYTFEQNLPSYLASPIRYIGETQQSNVKLSKLLNRSTNYKTNVYIKGYHKSTRNSFGGIDLVSQQRTTTGWNLGFQHRHYIGTGVLDFDLNYRHGTGAFAATSAPDILKHHSFNELIQPLASYFPKTYQYLVSQQIQYQVSFEWWGRFDVKDDLLCQPCFALHQRIYYLSPYDSFCRALPNYLLQGWSKYLGGIVCSDNGNNMWGKTLIDNPFHWQSFDDYLPRRNKKQLIKSLIERIPYVYVDTKEEDPTKQEKHRLKGFPNLRCMLDAREPMSQSKKYDLLLMCYEYNQTVYWVKDGDFERGIFEIEHVEDALDHYFLHVFSQHDQEFSRFDFSPWAGRHVLSKEVTIRQEIELDEDEDDEEVMSIPVSDPELAAKLGHVPNQLRLGFCYSLGIEGFDKDLKRGHDWFWQAIKSGSLLAQYNWASFWCEEADYIREEASFTLQTLEHMHQQGNLAATYMLGVCYEQGSLGLQLNPQFAVQYYQQAADQGFAPAMNNLADKYETGVGVAQDLNKAFELYNIAAEQEIAAAQWSLAVMYLNGTPIARDDAQGKYYLEKALSNGWDNAQVILDTLD